MLTFGEAARRGADRMGEEVVRLATQDVRGMVVPPEFEEAFYHSVNLPEQLGRLFTPINPARIDEDALEGLTARAEALIRTSFLMDDAVQIFYRALHNAGLDCGAVHVRRPGLLSTEEAQVTPPGTAALQAVKRLWARDWAFGAVLTRLDETGGVGLDARPTLILPGLMGTPDPVMAEALGVQSAWVNETGLVGLP
ncbi:hypothetical protein [Deinococcus humi]|uniref:Uncharacterized protein n=1 Tax=Deinococcus humi TaxID=662880 RepID=A0A7W8JXK5_9DEIO|nr:hypothetical protein [Deinococcus humi]MBB5364718.1 hypothetical protein [Deinococcus humi]GGO34365.1 hypothetical protein GCM10008949_35060 [Deinococcus humi]